jgi:endonuclease III related protein
VGLSKAEQIRAFYRTLFRAWGRQHWWPAQSRFEVIVGAFLTQNTAWTNVEKAMAQLRRERALSLAGIRNTPIAKLEQLIRSAGYFRQKAQRLKNFVQYLDSRYGGSLDRMFARPTAELREELLALNGIGPETADSILLYAGNHPVFVVDAYTRRILERHRFLPLNASYEDVRKLFEEALGEAEFVGECQLETAVQIAGPRGSCHSPSRISTARRTATAQVFNEMHGLIVGVGKNYCLKSKPLCEECPLREFLPVSGPRIRKQAPKRVTKRQRQPKAAASR